MTTSPVTVVVHIHAKDGQQALVRSELEKLIPITLAEAGCLGYDLHVDNADDKHFVFYETWESEELLEAHSKAPHLAAFGAATKDAVERFSLDKMTRIAPATE
ncbi:antibiotic biosynthesis monooxygenase [Thecamonas trahens ATCC 50062]|uniref:Antibiotic biosynthesis monooxygenase n=1 Tax=Thecamonas trahens ATCC 50062 TaxID=461836 RepID=A0A0L0D7H8_THETB|nr:antibiotic biosynthesis monooxygenase [Thecamonas trahens ATCC 50062]KNC48309.1 antibiotic biosynthesis monooxygenase [Thecamonas trahens ATCC 50062]|eukprot:XP_013758876.1 antibiotic biosynthesis monooxygenase [Thecamonas trahens ATCC 50062]